MSAAAPGDGAGRRRWLGQVAGAGLGTALGSALGLSACSDGGPAPPTLASLPPSTWWGSPPARGHRLRQPLVAPPATQRRCDVAILGAGIAGLAAARALRAAGITDFRLFELEDQAGGNARAHQMGGLACPVAAHYLPVPQPPAHEVIDWLHEIGLLRQHLGRSLPDERHLCHSPQERLWLQGPWVEGLLPPAAPGSQLHTQYRRLAAAVAQAQRTLGFALPSWRAPWQAGHAALDGQTFAHWLDAQGLDHPALRWYLDYCCRDDYGAGSATVSAWAGLHYFASRHGFHAPGDEAAERDAVFTWPEGNAWLVQRLAQGLGDRLHTGALVRRIEAQRHGVSIDVEAANAPNQGSQAGDGAAGPAAAFGPPVRWLARHAIVALPLHVAARLMPAPPPALREAAARVQHAPWLVANLQLAAPLVDKPGAAPAWDNVLLPAQVLAPLQPELPAELRAAMPPTSDRAIATAAMPEDAGALGYVDARHQALRPVPGPTVLSVYWALGDGDAAQCLAQRQALAQPDPRPWALRVLQHLARAHPDLPAKTVAISLARHGHAMAMPVPGYRGLPALAALAQPAPGTRLHFAHADVAGYSVFEEAFTLGHAAGQAVARALR